MGYKDRLNKIEKAISARDPQSAYVCKACGRDQKWVIAMINPGQTPKWPRCDHCPAPGVLVKLVIEGYPVPTLPPPPPPKSETIGT